MPALIRNGYIKRSMCTVKKIVKMVGFLKGVENVTGVFEVHKERSMMVK